MESQLLPPHQNVEGQFQPQHQHVLPQHPQSPLPNFLPQYPYQQHLSQYRPNSELQLQPSRQQQALYHHNQQQEQQHQHQYDEYLHLLQLAGDVVEEDEGQHGEWMDDPLLTSSGMGFPLSHRHTMWCVQIQAILSKGTAIAYQLVNTLCFDKKVPTSFLGLWYSDYKLVADQPTPMTLYFATPRDFVNSSFLQSIKDTIFSMHTLLPIPKHHNDKGDKCSSGSSKAPSYTKRNDRRKMKGEVNSQIQAAQSTSPSSSSMMTATHQRENEDRLSIRQLTTIVVKEVPERFTLTTIRSHQPNNDAIKRQLIIGNKCIVAVHSTDNSTFVTAVANFEPQTVYSSVIAQVKKQTTGTFMVCRDVRSRTLVVLDDSTDTPLPWEQQRTSGAKVLHVFLQPRIYALHCHPEHIQPRRSAILFCDNVPRTDVLIGFLSKRQLALRSFYTFPYTLEIEGSQDAIASALHEYKHSPFAVKNAFGNSAALSSSIRLQVLQRKGSFNLHVPRFMKPRDLLLELSLITGQPQHRLFATIQTHTFLGGTKTALLQPGMYHELAHFCPHSKGRVVVALKEDELQVLQQQPFLQDLIPPHSHSQKQSQSQNKGVAGVSTHLVQHPSTTPISLPILPSTNGLTILATKDILMLPKQHFESYSKRCTRRHGINGEAYVSAHIQLRSINQDKQVDLRPFMRTSKKVRTAMINACSQHGFSSDAIKYLLKERERTLDAHRKAKTRQNLKKEAMDIVSAMSSILNKLVGDNDDGVGKKGMLVGELQRLVVSVAKGSKGLKQEIMRGDAHKILSQAQAFLSQSSYANTRGSMQ
eukprot:m.217971 g.217971  ORF g.217971 m.217971 type:complete len:813 (+) comp13812_c0_seq39:1919-4357(+)